MTAFADALRVFQSGNARALAGDLFRKSFRADFPVPVDKLLADLTAPAADWHQFVAMYRWPDGADECIGFLNYIKYREVYLVGGLCVKADFYRHLPQSHFADCKVQGGVAQIMLDTAAKELADGMALVGYCGDARARKVGLRAGYIPTRYPFLIIKALARLDQRVFDATLDDVARIGAF